MMHADLREVDYTVWDVETTTRKSFNRLSNPFDGTNWVVMSGHRIGGDGKLRAQYWRDGTGKPEDWFTQLLATRLLVGQNLKFDILHALCDKEHGATNYRAWQTWVARGGLVWDTQLAEYLLEGMAQHSQMISLDELAPRYGGNLKFDEVKVLWSQGVDTADIDPGLLRRYLIGTDTEHGDIGNTEIVFKGQLERAVAAKQVPSILLNMGALIATIEMEYNGLKVDVELGYKQAEELAEQIAELDASLKAFLPADLPFEFNWGSNFHKSALIFGGPVKYSKRVPILDDRGQQAYARKKVRAYLLDDGGYLSLSDDPNNQELNYVNETLLARGVTYSSGKNAGEYKTKMIDEPDLDKPKSRMEDFIYEFPRITEPKRSWQRSDNTNYYSTSSEVIEEISIRGIPFLEQLAKIQQLTKDLTTYYITTKADGSKAGMLTLVQPDGLIHHGLNMTSTVTARLSSSNPNAQNIPRKDKSQVKRLFVSRFDSGVVVQSDWTSLEVYVQAILTKSRRLIDDLLAGVDMHVMRVAAKVNKPYEWVLAQVKAGVPQWKAERQGAKEFSFQRAYGAGAAKIAYTTGMSEDEVKLLIKAENTRYPEIEPYYERLTERIKQAAYPINVFFDHPDMPGLKGRHLASSYRTPDRKVYSYRTQPSPKFVLERTGEAVTFSPTEIKNYVVQGTGGEWAKAGMYLAVRSFYAAKNFGGCALLINQVHDAMYVDAAPEVQERASALLDACMRAASEYMEYLFNWRIPVPVPCETTWGASMYEEAPVSERVADLSHAYRSKLRTLYMDGYVPSFEKEEP